MKCCCKGNPPGDEEEEIRLCGFGKAGGASVCGINGSTVVDVDLVGGEGGVDLEDIVECVDVAVIKVPHAVVSIAFLTVAIGFCCCCCI